MLVRAAAPVRASQPVLADAHHGLDHLDLAVVDDGITVRLLVAGVDQCVGRQRVVIRRRGTLLDQTPQHTNLNG